LPSLMPITRIHIQCTQCLATLREAAYPEYGIKINFCTTKFCILHETKYFKIYLRRKT